MANYTLTAGQQATLDLLIKETESQQNGLAVYQASVIAGQARVDACYTDCETAMNELGLAAVPSPITEVHKEYDANNVWTGKVYINEPLP